MKKRTGLKILALIVIIMVSIFGLHSLNSYLKRESLLIYAKGTDQKAFLNATWEMTIREVERANGCPLSDGYDFSAFESDLDNLLDPTRIQWKKSCLVKIFGANREVYYDFFDNQLFRIKILGDVYNQKGIDSLIINSLESKYGKVVRDTENEFAGKFLTDNVEIYYDQFEYNDKNNERVQHFKIEITYKPLMSKIKSTSKQEQNNIF